MTQGICGGATSYLFQSDEDILHDIINWIEWSNEVKEYLNDMIYILKNNGYWERVGFDFRMLIYDFILFNNTAISDLEQVKQAIENRLITSREVALLRTIGSNAIKLNNDMGIVYNNGDWHDYSDPNFTLVEKIYAKSRDHCVVIQDAGNAALRLRNYAMNSTINSININGEVSGNQIQIGTIASQQINNSSDNQYEQICCILQKIKEYTYEKSFSIVFGDDSEKFKNILSESIVEAHKKQKQDSALLISKVELLKNMTLGISSGVIANKISDGLKALFEVLKNL